MVYSVFRRLSVLLFLVFVIPSTLTFCTSSDDDSSVIEDEIEAMEEDVDAGDTMEEDVEDLADLSGEDLTDEEDEEDDLDIDEEDDELAELEDDVEDGDKELAEDDKNVASNDDEEGFGEDDEFAEFDDLNEEGGNKEKPEAFAQNEQSLAEEMNQQPQYPVAENAQPQFPEEVMGAQNSPPGTPPGVPPEVTSQTAAVTAPVITSETQDIDEDPLAPEIPNDDLGMADPLTPSDEDMPPARSWIPVVKVKKDPFFRNSRLMNAVYIARPDDSIDSISQKLFEDDRTKELKADNPHLDKGIDPGDKVYYNSPNRSEDRSTLKVYYSDIGLKPQYYRTKKNDNMRRLGSKLLGFQDGWKEVWAINPHIDSKTILPAGMELKYWTGNETTPNQEMAQTAIEEIPSPEPKGDGAMAAGTIEDETFEADDFPPETPLPQAQVDTSAPALDPEPIPDIEPFPEEGVEETPPKANTATVAQPANNDSLLQMGAIALLLIAGIGLVAIQIKKRKDATGIHPASMEYTQV